MVLLFRNVFVCVSSIVLIFSGAHAVLLIRSPVCAFLLESVLGTLWCDRRNGWVFTPKSANSLTFFYVCPMFFLGFRRNFQSFPSTFARQTLEITPKTQEKHRKTLDYSPTRVCCSFYLAWLLTSCMARDLVKQQRSAKYYRNSTSWFWTGCETYLLLGDNCEQKFELKSFGSSFEVFSACSQFALRGKSATERQLE